MESIPSSHLLCVYAEPLARGRRVLVVGDSSDDVGERLVELGARLVHVYDPDTERALQAEPGRGVLVRPLYDGEFEARDGAFDLVLIPELSAVRDPVALLARLRRAVGAEGAVLVATRNTEGEGAGVDYYDLYEMMALQFTHVRMIGQVPFYGAAIAELGDSDDAPDVSVHTELATAPEEPAAFIALGSHGAHVRLDPYAIVQLPRETWSAVKTQELPACRIVPPDAAARLAALETELAERPRRAALAGGGRAWGRDGLQAQGTLEQAVDRLRAAEDELASPAADGGARRVAASRAGVGLVLAERAKEAERVVQRWRSRCRGTTEAERVAQAMASTLAERTAEAERVAQEAAITLAERAADAERIALERGEQTWRSRARSTR